MVRIGDVVVSLDVIERYFCCDLDNCKGACCIDGDAGAPITEEEEREIKTSVVGIKNYLSDQALRVIDAQGVSYRDRDGDLVTSIVGDKDCVFCTYDPNGICFCALEKGFNSGACSFKKPISCYLYPIRITKYSTFTAVNYDERKICRGAEANGREKKIRTYQFLREPLIKYFGKEWYEELLLVATEYIKQKREQK